MEFVGGRRPVATEQTAPARGTDPEITSVKYGIGFDCFVGRSGPRPLFGETDDLALGVDNLPPQALGIRMTGVVPQASHTCPIHGLGKYGRGGQVWGCRAGGLLHRKGQSAGRGEAVGARSRPSRYPISGGRTGLAEAGAIREALGIRRHLSPEAQAKARAAVERASIALNPTSGGLAFVRTEGP